MLKLRSTVAGTLVLVLLGGVGSVAAGQDKLDADAVPVGVIIEVAENGKLERGQYSKTSGAEYGTLYGRIYAETWEATDPRLSGDVATQVMRHEYPALGHFLESQGYKLVNDGGSWAGTGSGIAPTGSVGDYGHIFTVTLHGEGAYEGLTAFLTFANEMIDDYHWTLRGVIVGDELPPYPEPVAG